MGKLDGKVAIVTGAAQGMGAEEARILAAEGARVVLCDILDDEGASVASSIGAEYRHLDVTNEQDWSDLAAWAESSLGRIDILVNNAGVVGFTPVGATELAEWNRVIGINLTGVFLGIRAVAPALARAGGGVIVNISSTAGIMGYSNLSAYVASKWGVRGLTKAAALDLAELHRVGGDIHHCPQPARVGQRPLEHHPDVVGSQRLQLQDQRARQQHVDARGDKAAHQSGDNIVHHSSSVSSPSSARAIEARVPNTTQ